MNKGINSGILFNLLDKGNPNQAIWKLVRSKWPKPFKEDN